MMLIMGGNSELGRKIISKLGKDKIIISVRDLNKAEKLIGNEYQMRQADFDDRESLVKAFSGITSLFFISGNSPAEKRIQQHNNVIEIAKKMGVKHIIYTSFIDVDSASPFIFSHTHEKTEAFIQQSGIDYTILRNNLYADYISRIRPDAMDCISLPAGDGKVAFISREDIAIFAVKVLMEPGIHKNKVYKLTGSKAYSWFDIAKVMSEKYKKTISYQPISLENHISKLLTAGMPKWMAEAVSSMYVAVSDPNMGYGKVSQDFEAIVGYPAQEPFQFIQE